MLPKINPQTKLPYTSEELYKLGYPVNLSYGHRNSIANTSSLANEPSVFGSLPASGQPTQQTSGLGSYLTNNNMSTQQTQLTPARVPYSDEYLATHVNSIDQQAPQNIQQSQGLSGYFDEHGNYQIDQGKILNNTMGSGNNPPKPDNTVDNTLGYVNAGIGLGSLAANIYYAEQNKRAQEDATRYARSRDAMADAKVAKFQRNMLHGS